MADPVPTHRQAAQACRAEGPMDLVPAEPGRGSPGDAPQGEGGITGPPEEAPAEGQGRSWAVLDELAVKICARCDAAEQTADLPAVARLRAMRAVVATRLIPMACPDAVTVAGDAARAAYQGLCEPDWYAAVYARHRSSPDRCDQFNVAIRLLKSAHLWPWDRQGWDNLTRP